MAAPQARLRLAAPAFLERLSLFVGANESPETFDGLNALATRIVELQATAPGLRIGATAATCYYPDLAPFPGFNVYRTDAAGDQWIATAAILQHPLAALEGAIRRVKGAGE